MAWLIRNILLGGLGWTMAQGQLPPIRGKDWSPEGALEFINSLPADAAKGELLRFTAERHDGHLQLVEAVWDFVHRDEPSFDGEAWHEFLIVSSMR